MHELSVTQEILNIAIEKAREAGATSIKRINLVIGDISSCMDDSVRFYFEILSKNNIAQGAELDFRRIPVSLRCRHCGQVYTPTWGSWDCPQCGRAEIDVIAGHEFYVDNIEIE
jgi:hydrogenase nickel incorporation protein HypA/HybF